MHEFSLCRSRRRKDQSCRKMRKKAYQQQIKWIKKGEMNERTNKRTNQKKQQHCFPFSMRQRNDFFLRLFFPFNWKCAMRQINERTNERKEILYSTHFMYDSNTLTRRKQQQKNSWSDDDDNNNNSQLSERNAEECSAFGIEKLEMGEHTNAKRAESNWMRRWDMLCSVQKNKRFMIFIVVICEFIAYLIDYCLTLTIEALLNCKIIQLNTMNTRIQTANNRQE